MSIIIKKMKHNKISIGIMGFGHIGRYVYLNTLDNPYFEIKAISDIGSPDVFEYLIKNEPRNKKNVIFDGSDFVYKKNKTKFLNGENPGDVDWELLDVDWVIDATGKFLSKSILKKHIDTGAKKVIISGLPSENLDNIIIPGINIADVNAKDKLISAGSSTTNAMAIMLDVINKIFEIECASMTTVHSYTNDQPLQDSAGKDLRRSRSAAKNIIPNENFSYKWVSKVLPEFQSKIISSALNVPVQFGSLMDLTVILKKEISDIKLINDVFKKASFESPELIKIAKDPIVSSDVIGSTESIIFDSIGSLLVSPTMIKILSWYDNGFNHASRILDVISAYEVIDK